MLVICQGKMKTCLGRLFFAFVVFRLLLAISWTSNLVILERLDMCILAYRFDFG